MAIPKKVLLLTAAAASTLTYRYAPALALSQRWLWNALLLFLAQWGIQFTWQVLVFPFVLSPLRHLPQPEGGSFFLGHFPTIFTLASGQPQRGWIDTVPNDGVIYYRWLFNEPRVFVTNPKTLTEVLTQRSYEFEKPSRIRTGLGRLLGVGILLAEGDEHKRQRRALMPAFSFRHVKDLYPVFWDKSCEMVDTIAHALKTDPTGSSAVEIREWCSRATLDIIGVAGLGHDFDSLANPDNELNVTYRTIFNPHRDARLMQLAGMFVPEWLLRLLPLKRNEEFKDAIRVIRKTAANLIRSKREKLEKGGRTEVDILSVALESGGFTDEDLVNQLMTFLAAGHETTASALSWAVYLLCKHPEEQARLREELLAQLPALSDPSVPITSTEIDRLAYLNAVINETSRIFPPVPLTMRDAAHDTTIAEHFIPKGTTIIICPWATNMSRALWGPDAQDFKPERWLEGPGSKTSTRSAYAISTFLHGPRSCIGKDFAKAEFACLLAALVGRFEMSLEDPEWVLEIQGGITARPKGGLRVKLREVGGEKGAVQ